MNDWQDVMYVYHKEALRPEDISEYRPAATLGNMTCESGMPTDWFNLKADVASSESQNNTLYKIIEEIIDRTMPRSAADSPFFQTYVDCKPRPKRRKSETKQPEEELGVGDTSSLDAFMGEFTVLKRVGEV